MKEIMKAVGLTIILVFLGSIVPSPAQQAKMVVYLSYNVVKEQQGKCPGYDA